MMLIFNMLLIIYVEEYTYPYMYCWKFENY